MDIKEFTVGWGTFALINAGLAQGKDKSGLCWFIVSLFLGPIAILLLVLSDSDRGVKTQSTITPKLEFSPEKNESTINN